MLPIFMGPVAWKHGKACVMSLISAYMHATAERGVDAYFRLYERPHVFMKLPQVTMMVPVLQNN